MKDILLRKNDFLAETMCQKDLEIARLRSELSAKQEEIEALEGQLGTAFKMGNIARDQAVATLKGDISWGLELDYADYLASKDDACEESLFAHYRATLSRIFKLLRRHGIPCE